MLDIMIPKRTLRDHITQSRGHFPIPFDCDHIERWLDRTGTTGRSGMSVNTGAGLHSGHEYVLV